MGGRLKAGLLLVAIFALGALSGIAWQNYQIDRQGLHNRYVARRVRWLKRQLHLTPLQEEALLQIIQDAHERMAEVHQKVSSDMAEIHEDSIDNFRDFLTPEQQTKFDKLHKKSHARKTLEAPAPVTNPPPLEPSDVEESTS